MNILIKKSRKIVLLGLSVIFAGCFMFTGTINVSAATAVVNFDVAQSFSGINASNMAGTYRFTAGDANNPMPSGASSGIYSFNLDGNDSESIKIDFSAVHTGIYTYKLKQTTSAQDGYSYDDNVYTVKYMVKYDQGTESKIVEVFVYRSDGNKTASVVFKNSYKADSAIADPPVIKQVSGNTPSDSVFKFKLEAENKSNPMPSGSSNGVKYITIKGNGTSEFGTWTYIKSGTYAYKVLEANTGVSGYKYDTKVYTLTDVVTVDEYGGILIERSIDGNMATSASRYKFVNRYVKSHFILPNTGDINKIMPYIVIAATGAAAIAFILLKRRRYRNGERSVRRYK